MLYDQQIQLVKIWRKQYNSAICVCLFVFLFFFLSRRAILHWSVCIKFSLLDLDVREFYILCIPSSHYCFPGSLTTRDLTHFGAIVCLNLPMALQHHIRVVFLCKWAWFRVLHMNFVQKCFLIRSDVQNISYQNDDFFIITFYAKLRRENVEREYS